MAGNIVSVSNGIVSGTQPVARSGSERPVQKDAGDQGKAQQSNDVAATQSAIVTLKSAPNENSRTDFQNAVKEPDQASKANDARAAEASAALQESKQNRGQPPQESTAAAPEPSRQTRELQDAAQAAQARQAAESAFLTRQDLAAAAASASKPSSLGKNVDTTA